MSNLSLIVISLGFIMWTIGYVWLLVISFRTNPLWGLACLFIYPMAFIFVLIHSTKAAKPFFYILIGMVAMITGIVLMPGA